MMTWVNEATAKQKVALSSLNTFLHLLSPFAPHICDELRERLGFDGYLLNGQWPGYQEQLLSEQKIDLVAQVNGKRRSNLSVNKGLTKIELENLVLNDPEVKRFIDGQQILRIVVVPDRLVNVVVKQNE